MTVRAVIFGLMGALVIGGLGYLNDNVLQLESITAGHLLSVAVFVLVLLGVFTVALLGILVKRYGRFRLGEVAVAMTLMLAGVSIPGPGLLETFTPVLAMPAYYNQSMLGWKKHELLSYVPPSMLPADAKYDKEVVEGFLSGLAKPGQLISLTDVPWAKWEGALVTWLPLIVLTVIAMTCMALIVHRQWADRERLRYPISDFATCLISQRLGPDTTEKPIFRNKLFWTGLGLVLTIHVVNGLHSWFDSFIQIPMEFSFSQIGQKWPIIARSPWEWNCSSFMLLPSAIAFSYFLSSDIALSLGIGQYVLMPIMLWLMSMGVDVTTDYMSGGLTGWQRFGSCLAFALTLAYIGRRYYWQLLKRTFTFLPQREVAGYEAWACRILILALAAMVAIIVSLGLDWPLAVMTVGLMMMTFMLVSRISAETGLFFIQPRWQALGVFLGLFGAFALGPKAVVMVGLLCAILSFDPSQSLMPYIVNAIKTCDNLRVKPARVAWGAAGTYVLCLGVAIVVVIWSNYNWGVRRHPFITGGVPQMTFKAADTAVTKIKQAEQLEESQLLGPVERLMRIKPEKRFAWSAGLGFAAVLIFSAMRLRFPWWPVHPVMFLMWATWPLHRMGTSFLFGWVIRTVVVRIGGYNGYRAGKPFMVGAVAGDLVGAGLWMTVGVIYYGATGLRPDTIWVFEH